MREVLVKNEEFKDSPLGKIPKDWEIKTLGELGNFQNGLNKGKKDFGFGTKFVNILDVYTQRLNIDKLGRMNAIQSEISSYQLEFGDILLDRSSVKLDGVGYPTVFEGAGEPVIFCGFIIRFRLSTSAVKPRFLCELMRNEFFRNRVFQIATRSANVNVNQEQLAKLWVAFPSPSEQEQIIEILDTVDEAIARTSSLIIKLKQTKAGLLQDLLTRGLDEDGKLRDPQAHPEQFKDSPLGQIPKDWEIESLNNVCWSVVDCPHTTPVFQNEGILLARTSNIRDGVFNQTEVSYVSKKEYFQRIARLKPQSGDIIFTREAPVGEAFIIPKNMEICLGQRTMLLRPNIDKAYPDYLIAQIYSGSVRARINQLVGGTTNPHLNVADVRTFLLPVPSCKEQAQIASVFNIHHTRIRTEEAYLNKLKLQKQGLMQDLLTGKVRVKNL